MKFAFYLTLLMGVFLSCNQSDEVIVSDMNRLNLSELEKFTLNEKYRGSEHREQLKEIFFGCRHEEKKIEKVKELLAAVDKIDKISSHRMALLHDLKNSILKNVGCNDCITAEKQDLYTSRIDISKANSSWSKNHLIKDLREELFQLATELCTITTESHVIMDESGNVILDDRFFFNLKKPLGKDLNAEIGKQLDNSNVHPDDKFLMLDLVIGLLSNVSNSKELSTIDALNYYTYVQRKVMSARALAIANIKSRISYCGPNY